MGGIFKKPKAPKVEVQAPPLDNPIPEPVEPELGSDLTPDQKKRKGKKGLKIDMNKPNSTGLNKVI